MIGQKVLHYQVTEKLGEGGIGVVYKAQDTKLHRTVALKFLNADILESAEDQEKLAKEARAAAALNHPNICTIYEINDWNDQTFIAMEYIDGLTLRDRVLSDTVSIVDAVKMTLQIAQGMSRAHEKGIIHRDIKSANIMVDADGKARIMDFGLARMCEEVAVEGTFSSGGTSAYMSPEQARGDAVDQRTDIWSLGVVMYELLAGHVPFRGDYQEAVIYSIINEDAPSVLDARPDTPPEIAVIIERCLAKDPEARYANVNELVAELKSVLAQLRRRSGRGGSVARGRITIPAIFFLSVLAISAAYSIFDFLAGDEAESLVRMPIAVVDFRNGTDELALDGLSGMLITALEQSRRLSVMTRTRMFDILKTLGRDNVNRIDESLGQEVCRIAGVNALVIPEIRKFGDLYTIDLKVLDTRSNEYLLTRKEEGRGQESIPGMIDNLARHIRANLKQETEAFQETQTVADYTTVSLDAYQQYFEGQELLNKLEFGDAAERFEKAIELDSTFALAYYRLGYTEWWSRKMTEETKAHVARAIELIDRVPDKERYLVRALSAGVNEGFSSQIGILKEMERRYPQDKEMLFGLGDAFFHTNEFDSASVYFERVLALDPEFERALQHQTWTLLRLDRDEAARDLALQWVEKIGSAEAYSNLVTACRRCGDLEGALKHAFVAEEKFPDNAAFGRLISKIYMAQDEREKAEKVLVAGLEKAVSEKEPDIYKVAPAFMALAANYYPYYGRYDDAFKQIEAARSFLTEAADTMNLVKVEFAHATLRFWSVQDTAAVLQALDRAELVPEKKRDLDFWLQLGVNFCLVGQSDKGLRIVKDNVEIPVLSDAFQIVGKSLSGDCVGAETAADTLFASDARFALPEGIRASVQQALGACHLRSGDYDKAIVWFDESVATHEMMLDFSDGISGPKVTYWMGIAHEETGQVQEAADYYRKFLDLWRDADEDLPDLQDAKSRLARIESSSSM